MYNTNMPDIFTAKKVSKEVKNNKNHNLKKTTYKDLPTSIQNPLSAIMFCPENLKFETMDAEEKVVLFLRKHFITNLGWILMSVLMAIAPFFVDKIGVLSSVPDNFRFMFMLIWYLVTSAYFLESFLTWYFNIYIVTDERIIDVDFYNLIYKEVSDANIDKIQDVTYKMGGVIRTIFNYGDVLVQTASEVPNFEFLAVPKPDQVVKVLQDLRIEEQQEAIEGRVR